MAKLLKLILQALKFKNFRYMSDNTFDKEQENAQTADNVADQKTSNEEKLNNDDNVEGAQHMEDKVDEGDEQSKLEKELEEQKDKYIRLVAEFENFKRRTSKEKQDLIMSGGQDIVKALLAVLDDSDRAAKQLETATELDEVKEGVTLVFNKLRSTLEHKGVSKMEIENAEFNPDLHEAITEIPAPTEDMKGKVIDVVENGYYLNDKIIRHAKVVVGK